MLFLLIAGVIIVIGACAIFGLFMGPIERFFERRAARHPFK